MNHDQLIQSLRNALRECKNAAENHSLPASARLELVRDCATPALYLPNPEPIDFLAPLKDRQAKP